MTIKLQNKSIGIVTSEFNTEITSKLKQSCYQTLLVRGIPADQIHLVDVPGAIEIPLILQLMAQEGQYKALIALGAVIRGETSHYDYVCAQVSNGCQEVMLKHNLPVIFGVLTTENDEQALARAGGDHSDKGAESAEAALKMIEITSNL